jgi:hypothetical protein
MARHPMSSSWPQLTARTSVSGQSSTARLSRRRHRADGSKHDLHRQPVRHQVATPSQVHDAGAHSPWIGVQPRVSRRSHPASCSAIGFQALLFAPRRVPLALQRVRGGSLEYDRLIQLDETGFSHRSPDMRYPPDNLTTRQFDATRVETRGTVKNLCRSTCVVGEIAASAASRGPRGITPTIKIMPAEPAACPTRGRLAGSHGLSRSAGPQVSGTDRPGKAAGVRARASIPTTCTPPNEAGNAVWAYQRGRISSARSSFLAHWSSR